MEIWFQILEPHWSPCVWTLFSSSLVEMQVAHLVLSLSRSVSHTHTHTHTHTHWCNVTPGGRVPRGLSLPVFQSLLRSHVTSLSVHQEVVTVIRRVISATKKKKNRFHPQRWKRMKIICAVLGVFFDRRKHMRSDGGGEDGGGESILSRWRFKGF